MRKKKWICNLLITIFMLTLLIWWSNSSLEKSATRPEASKDHRLKVFTEQLHALSSYLPLDDVFRKFQKSLQNISCNLKLNKYEFDPDTTLNVSGLISRQGYPVEEYHVVTEDGFILGVQRIPYGRNRKQQYGDRQVVFLLHGLGGTATHWVENQANQSLAFILADAGFDVWLGNVRGTRYSLKHIRLKQTDKDFWKWSWDAMALYDLPAMLDLALRTTKQKKLFYVGHSQGTLIAFAALSQSQRLNNKVKMFFALAPVATVSNITSPIRYFADYDLIPSLMDAFSMLHIYSFLPNHPLTSILKNSLCENDKSAMICESVIFTVAGYDCKRMNHSRFQVYLSNSPGSTSMYNLNHYSQMVLSGEFSKYDYGILGNFYRYRQTKPPNYVIENIQTPVALFWGGNDMVADPTDVRKLRRRLKDLVFDGYIKEYNHLDFIWSMDAANFIYNDILNLMRNYKEY